MQIIHMKQTSPIFGPEQHNKSNPLLLRNYNARKQVLWSDQNKNFVPFLPPSAIYTKKKQRTIFPKIITKSVDKASINLSPSKNASSHNFQPYCKKTIKSTEYIKLTDSNKVKEKIKKIIHQKHSKNEIMQNANKQKSIQTERVSVYKKRKNFKPMLTFDKRKSENEKSIELQTDCIKNFIKELLERKSNYQSAYNTEREKIKKTVIFLRPAHKLQKSETIDTQNILEKRYSTQPKKRLNFTLTSNKWNPMVKNSQPKKEIKENDEKTHEIDWKPSPWNGFDDIINSSLNNSYNI